tara:strand:+ start:13 stop:546 length:534 start_codon:yes stop_codon:yes gene_type:complete
MGTFYKVRSNYTSKYIIEIKGKDVFVYTEEDNKLYKKYKTEKKFIGKVPDIIRGERLSWFQKFFVKESPPFVKTSESFKKRFEGNTILLELKENKYVIIDNISVKEFKIKDDKIISFVSPVERNDVSYPIATGKKYYYFLFDKSRVLKKEFPEEIHDNPYLLQDYYYSHDLEKEILY